MLNYFVLRPEKRLKLRFWFSHLLGKWDNSIRFKTGISTSDLRCVSVYVATFHQSLRPDMPEESSLHGHRHESHKSQMLPI